MRDVADTIAHQHLRSVVVKDEFIAASCPFHKSGQERNPSFWISRSSGNWGCFSCHVYGKNLRELLSQLGAGVTKINVLLEGAEEDAKKTRELDLARRKAKARSSFKGVYGLPESLLGVYDFLPAEMIEAGFDEDLLRKFDIGYDRNRDRVTFPIRDIFGNLLGISGRNKEGVHPKYKIYSGWKQFEGKWYPGELGDMFPGYKSDDVKNHLWGAHLTYDDLFNNRFRELILVEGYKACLRMWQSDWTYTNALMGSALTAQQERIVRRTGADIWVLMDNDNAGRNAAEKISKKLAEGSQKVHMCIYPEGTDGCQPDDLGDDDIAWILSNAERAGGRHARRMDGSETRGRWSQTTGW